MAEDLQESITIAACTCMRLSIIELWNNSYQLEGVPVIVHGLDVPSRALTEVVSSETQQPSNTPPSRPSVANLILWWVIFSSGREISRWKRIHFCKNVPRLICLCEDYDVSLFWQVYPFRSIGSTQTSEIWRRYSPWSVVDIMILPLIVFVYRAVIANS